MQKLKKLLHALQTAFIHTCCWFTAILLALSGLFAIYHFDSMTFPVMLIILAYCAVLGLSDLIWKSSLSNSAATALHYTLNIFCCSLIFFGLGYLVIHKLPSVAMFIFFLCLYTILYFILWMIWYFSVRRRKYRTEHTAYNAVYEGVSAESSENKK